MRHRVAGAEKDDRLAVEQDAPSGRTFDAGDHLHQGRLARAVLADQDVDRAAPHGEIGLLDRDGAGIDFGHPFQAQDDVGFVFSGGGVGHGLGPIVISTGVTSGGVPVASSAKAPIRVILRPMRSSRGSFSSVLWLTYVLNDLPKRAKSI